LPAPSRERTERALATQVRDDQRSVDALRGKELVVGECLEAREPLVALAVARGESIGCEITETIVV
jgi:hypothetical protein